MEDPFFEEDPFLYDEDLEQEGHLDDKLQENQEAIAKVNRWILITFLFFGIVFCLLVAWIYFTGLS